jgi:kynurenine formamidase
MYPYLDAQDDDVLQWIIDTGLSALIADNYAVEGWPAPSTTPHTLLPIHHLCLFKLGVPLGELWYLNDLAAWLRENKRSSFLLTAPPLRLPGTAGCPLTPVATV